MGRLSAEIGVFLAGLAPVAQLRTAYREFYRSENVQEDAELRAVLPIPSNRKVKLK